MMRLNLSSPVLFLEFFVREFTFFGKGTTRAQLPEDAFFYMGTSKANRYRYFESVHGEFILRDKCQQEWGFNTHQPIVSSKISQDQQHSWLSPSTRAIIKMTGEYFHENEWVRAKNKTKIVKYSGDCDALMFENIQSLAPYHFDVHSVSELGDITTHFPRKTVPLVIKTGESVCFLCRREEYEFAGWGGKQPNLNLVMWIKNYGFHRQLPICEQTILDRYDGAHLVEQEYKIRDFRKSRLHFELG
ncbi:TPA: hypothetical protein ACKRTE_002673 [Providencia rettgeri]